MFVGQGVTVILGKIKLGCIYRVTHGGIHSDSLHQRTVMRRGETQRQRPPSGGITEGEHGVPVVLGRGARGVVLRQEGVVEVKPSRRR